MSRRQLDDGGSFLWNLSPGKGPSDDYALDPHDLGLSSGLIERLTARYDTWETGGGRTSRRFAPSGGSRWRAWHQQGRRLAHQLRQELGPDVEVIYEEPTGRQGSPSPRS